MKKFSKKKSSINIGVMTVIDFIWFIFMTMGLLPEFGIDKYSYLSLIIALVGTLIVNLLMLIPFFGQVVKIICGLGFVAWLYIFVDSITKFGINKKGLLSTLHDDNALLPIWIAIITIAVIISVLYHLTGCIHRCPPAPSDETEPGKVIIDEPEAFDKLPPGNLDNSSFDKIAEIFNAAQQHYLEIKDIVISSFENNETKAYPEEFISIYQNLENQYSILENRMKAYIELIDRVSGIATDEMVTDIAEKANEVDYAVLRLESALRLLNQSMQKDDEPRHSYFRGCNTTEELKKRYNKLTQTYHPDLEAGDEETMKEINSEYDRLKSQMSK